MYTISVESLWNEGGNKTLKRTAVELTNIIKSQTSVDSVSWNPTDGK